MFNSQKCTYTSWATVTALSGSAVPCSKIIVIVNRKMVMLYDGFVSPSGKQLCFSLFHRFWTSLFHLEQQNPLSPAPLKKDKSANLKFRERLNVQCKVLASHTFKGEMWEKDWLRFDFSHFVFPQKCIVLCGYFSTVQKGDWSESR